MFALGKLGKQPRDRKDDRGSDAKASGKPPVVRRSSIRMFCLLALILVIYGALGPLGVAPGADWLAPSQEWGFQLERGILPYGDIATNILVFVPVGIAMRLLLRRRGRSGMSDLISALVTSVTLSYLVEFLQQFMPARVADLNDVLLNSGGAFVGVMLAPGTIELIRRIHGLVHPAFQICPWHVLTGATAVITALLMTSPWDFQLATIEVTILRDFDIPDVQRFGMFVFVGFFGSVAAAWRRRDSRRAMRVAMCGTVSLAVFLEASQMFISSHECSVLDISIAICGGLLGCWAGFAFDGTSHDNVRLNRPRRWFGGRWLAGAGLMMMFGYMLLSAPYLHRHHLAWRGVSGAFLAPFQVQFHQRAEVVIADLAETMVLYGIVCGLCFLVARTYHAALAFLFLIGSVTLIELTYATIAHTPIDLTAVLLAGVAWVFSVRIWRSMKVIGPSKATAQAAAASAEPAAPAEPAEPSANTASAPTTPAAA